MENEGITSSTMPIATENRAASNRPRAAAWPWLAILALVCVAVLLLRIEGRRWWCQCGGAGPWIGDVWTSHCSQHFFDPYSLTHVSHGLIFCWVLTWLRPRWPTSWQLGAALALASGWEVLENSSLIIERYRSATMSLSYLGDSVGNSLGDIVSCAIGFLIAKRIGFAWSFALFIALELLLLAVMRDNLTLGVVMLLWPIDAVKSWQVAGQPTSSI